MKINQNKLKNNFFTITFISVFIYIILNIILFFNQSVKFNINNYLLYHIIIFIPFAITFYFIGNLFLKNIFNNVYENIFFSSLTGLIIISLIIFIQSIFNSFNIYFFIIIFLISNIFFFKQNIKKIIILKNKQIDFKIIFILLSFIFINLFLYFHKPFTFFDTLVYHLSIPKKIADFGFYPIELNNLFNFYPIFIELITTIFYKLNLNYRIIYIYNFYLLLLLLLGCYCFSYKLFKLKFLSLINVIIILTTPGLLLLTIVFKNDIGIAAYLIAANFLLYLYLKSENNKFLILSFVFFGFSFLCKYTGLYYFTAFYISLFLISKNIKKKLIAYLFLPFIIFSPQLIHNYNITKNPVYPTMKRFFQPSSFLNSDIGNFNNRGWNKKTDFIKIPFYLYFKNKNFGSFSELLFLNFIFFFAGLFFLIRNYKNKFYKFQLLFILFSYLFWLITIPNIRYFFSQLFIIYIFGSYQIYLLIKKHYKYFFIVLILISIFLSLKKFNKTALMLFGYDSLKIAFNKMNSNDYLNNHFPGFQTIQFINKKIKKNNKILLFGETRFLYFNLYTIVSTANNKAYLTYYLKKFNFDINKLSDFFKKKKINYIYVNERELYRLFKQYKYGYLPQNKFHYLTSFFQKKCKLLVSEKNIKLYKIIK